MLDLEAKTKPQELIKAYLEKNATETLIEKINNGVRIVKDDKQLLSKKTLDGFMKYASDAARKTTEQGAKSACIEDSIVYGWAMHYFEEDSIEGTLYNLDGTEYKPVVKPKTATKTISKTAPTKKETTRQASFFDLNFDEDSSIKVDEKYDTENMENEIDEVSLSDTKPAVAETTTVDGHSGNTTEPCTNPTPSEMFYYKYQLMQKQFPENILFYRLGDFYEAFGKSAELASGVLNLTLTGKDCGSFGRMPLCGIPYHAIDTYVEKLKNTYGVVLMHSDNELQQIAKKDFAEIIHENAKRLEEIADEDEELGIVIDEVTDKEIDGLSAHDYNKYFNLDSVTDKETGEIIMQKEQNCLFEILYKLFNGRIIKG